MNYPFNCSIYHVIVSVRFNTKMGKMTSHENGNIYLEKRVQDGFLISELIAMGVVEGR